MIGQALDAGVVLGGEQAWNDWGHMGTGWGMGWAWGWMLLIWAVVLGLIVWGIVALTRSGRRESRGEQQPSAPDVLAMRFARGELSEEQYHQALAVLEANKRSGG